MGDTLGDDRPIAYWEHNEDTSDDTLIVRCSAFGGCLWELIASAQGYPQADPPAVLLKAFEEGKVREPKIIRQLVDDGWDLHSSQKEGELVLCPDRNPLVAIRYHPDSIGTPPWRDDQEYVVEIKALGDTLWQKAKRHGMGSTIKEYPWQLSIMMIAEGLPGVWVAQNKITGEFYYETCEIPPIGIEQLREHMNCLIADLDAELAARPCDDPKHWPCRYLGMRPEPEDAADALDLAGVSPEAMQEFDQAARDYLYARGQIDELETRKAHAQARLKELVGNFKKVRGAQFAITMVDGHSSHADRQKMIEDGVWDKYEKRTDYKYPRVKGLE